jgi:hypothetical protein
MRYILLNPGDIIREGDEVLRWRTREWQPAGSLCGREKLFEGVFRRKVDAALEPAYDTLFQLQEERIATDAQKA